MDDLVVDHVEHAVLQAVRRDEQVLGVLDRLALGQRAEHGVRLAADVLVRRHQREIGVQAGGLLVVVARADLRDVLGLAVHAPRDQAELGVHLVAVQAVDDVAPGLLQPARPFDVVLLVKAGLELHEHEHVLAVLGGFDERLDDLALARDAVERHLDGNDGVIVRRLVQHIDERLHALIRIGEQLVALADLREQGLAAAQQDGFLRDALAVEQLALLAQDVLNLEEEGQIERGGAAEDVAAVHVHVLAQRLDDVAVQLAGHLHANGCQALALFDQLDHELAVVEVLLVEGVGVDVGVARDADERLRFDEVAREGLVDEVQDELLGEHERPLVGGDLNEAGEDARVAGDDAQLLLAVLSLEHDGRVDLPVLEEREGLAAADDGGRDERSDLHVIVALQALALGLADLAEIDDAHADLFHLGHQLGVDGVAAGVEPVDGGDDRVDLLLRGHVRLVFAHGRRDLILIDERAHAHHEEFVEIALVDGGEGQPLAQRRARVFGLLEDPFVEFEPGQLPVHEDCAFFHGIFSFRAKACAARISIQFNYTGFFRKNPSSILRKSAFVM